MTIYQQTPWIKVNWVDSQPALNTLTDLHQLWDAWLRRRCLPPKESWAATVKGFFSLHVREIYTLMFECLLPFWGFSFAYRRDAWKDVNDNSSNDAVLRKCFLGVRKIFKFNISYFFEKLNWRLVNLGDSRLRGLTHCLLWPWAVVKSVNNNK